jgi:hypothetical protein
MEKLNEEFIFAYKKLKIESKAAIKEQMKDNFKDKTMQIKLSTETNDLNELIQNFESGLNISSYHQATNNNQSTQSSTQGDPGEAETQDAAITTGAEIIGDYGAAIMNNGAVDGITGNRRPSAAEEEATSEQSKPTRKTTMLSPEVPRERAQTKGSITFRRTKYLH